MFRFGHATHADWHHALELVLLQIEGQLQLEQFASDASRPQRLGLLYCTEAYADKLDTLLVALRRRTGVQEWVGAISSGVFSTGVEYFQEPAMAVMLMELPVGSFSVFSGKLPLPAKGSVGLSGRNAVSQALVHVDPRTDEIDDLLEDLSHKIDSSHIVGGLVSVLGGNTHIAREPLSGGVSGVLFSQRVPIEVRMTQGVDMVGKDHEITEVHGNFVLKLDGRPALDVLLDDLELPARSSDDDFLAQTADLLARRFTHGLFAGLTEASAAHSARMLRFSGGKSEPHQLRVRPVVGMDPGHRALIIAEDFKQGDRLVFCTRDENAARVDLIRMCTALRDELDASAPKLNALLAAGFLGMAANRRPRGAVYIACKGRGATLFGPSGTELQILREQLGDIPLIGFSANGEIFQGELYGYTGVLLLFF